MPSPEQLDLERSEKSPLRPLHEKRREGFAALEIDDDHEKGANSSSTTVAASSSALASPAAAAAAATGLAPYFRLLGTNAPFARLYAGELLNSAGQWFSYVSTLRIVNEASAAAAASSAASTAGTSASSASSTGGSASAIGVTGWRLMTGWRSIR